MTLTTTCYLGLGANLPFGSNQPVDTVQQAARRLSEAGLTNLRLSGFYRTSPYPASNQPDFVNCVAAVETDLLPEGVLELCQTIEQDLGRERNVRWDARTLDIDLLAYEGLVLPHDQTWIGLAEASADGTVVGDLVIPHPRLHERAFVLVPLRDLAPQWRHPVLRKTVSELLDGIAEGERAGVVPFSADLG